MDLAVSSSSVAKALGNTWDYLVGLVVGMLAFKAFKTP